MGYSCEDGPTVKLMFMGFATMFLSMLATLERNGLFNLDSEAKNIGAIMGLFIRFMVEVSAYGIRWDRQCADIEAYAAKHGITIHGSNHPRYEKPPVETVGLPEATANSNDPWGWKRTLANLTENTRGRMGGDSKGITSWTPAERKKVAFDKKDPISRSMMTHQGWWGHGDGWLNGCVCVYLRKIRSLPSEVLLYIYVSMVSCSSFNIAWASLTVSAKTKCPKLPKDQTRYPPLTVAASLHV